MNPPPRAWIAPRGGYHVYIYIYISSGGKYLTLRVWNVSHHQKQTERITISWNRKRLPLLGSFRCTQEYFKYSKWKSKTLLHRDWWWSSRSSDMQRVRWKTVQCYQQKQTCGQTCQTIKDPRRRSWNFHLLHSARTKIKKIQALSSRFKINHISPPKAMTSGMEFWCSKNLVHQTLATGACGLVGHPGLPPGK